MADKDKVDMSKLSASELAKKLTELRVELVEKKRALHAGELQNPRAITILRRQIATTLTLLNQRRRESEGTQEEKA